MPQNKIRKLLLHLWRVVPFSRKLRYRFLYTINQKFIIGVGVIVVDEKDRVLLFKHTYRAEYPWGLPTGWLKKGESPAQAVEREVYEESGFRVKVLEPFEVGHGVQDVPNVHIVFIGELVGEAEFVPSPEVTEAHFFHKDELPKLIPSQKRMIESFYGKKVAN